MSTLRTENLRAQRAALRADPERGEGLPSRPTCRSECPTGPCPWYGCRYHLGLRVTSRGSITYTWPGVDVEDMPATCALAVAEERGGTSHRELSELLGLKHPGAEYLVQEALAKVAEALDGVPTRYPGVGREAVLAARRQATVDRRAHVLRIIRESGGALVRELASLTGVHETATWQDVRALEAEGLACRVRVGYEHYILPYEG